MSISSFQARVSVRRRYAVAALLGSAVLAWAFYLQYFQDMEPCPLCWFQRLALGALVIVFALASLRPWSMRALSLLTLLGFAATCAGIGVAARHIWIQNLPADQVPACGQGIGFMLDTLPFFDVLAKALRGSGECAKRDLFLGLTLPSWTMGLFILAAIFLLFQWRQSQARQSLLNRQ